jgi:hypothetical protein
MLSDALRGRACTRVRKQSSEFTKASNVKICEIIREVEAAQKESSRNMKGTPLSL